ncbi:hypothetical protein Pint_30443 [Pistacia integerrima]|uniref:Uncharacterized protein n=1 Tax=Pistacia integerrima TaxID=434235 RepID=A0ACC0X0S0_9ROSI|nr:hypothetical protein Pint_30443 [Pistacia integerrima]
MGMFMTTLFSKLIRQHLGNTRLCYLFRFLLC